MKFHVRSSSVLLVLFVICTAVSAFKYDALPYDSHHFQNERESVEQYSILNSLYEQAKIVFNDIGTVGKKIIEDVVGIIPDAIKRVLKGSLVGLPQEVIINAIHKVCSAAVHSNAIQPAVTPSVHLMNFQLYLKDGEFISIPLLEPEKLWNNPLFNRNVNTTLVVTGWMSDANSTIIELLHRAYLQQHVNFVVFDTANFMASLYAWSAFNTEGVGKIVGAAIAEIGKEIGVNGIHLIGHSLGANICGYAGRHYTSLTNAKLPRITGLDPARPCFNEGGKLKGLQSGDALFVDIIHSNAGILGIKESRGDVDFFPNGHQPLQPGCWTVICSHSRSYEYFAESVNHGKHFIASQCNSLASLRNGRCKQSFAEMGLNTPHNARGNFYLETNSESPYGRSFNPYPILMEHSELLLV